MPAPTDTMGLTARRQAEVDDRSLHVLVPDDQSPLITPAKAAFTYNEVRDKIDDLNLYWCGPV